MHHDKLNTFALYTLVGGSALALVIGLIATSRTHEEEPPTRIEACINACTSANMKVFTVDPFYSHAGLCLCAPK